MALIKLSAGNDEHWLLNDVPHQRGQFDISARIGQDVVEIYSLNTLKSLARGKFDEFSPDGITPYASTQALIDDLKTFFFRSVSGGGGGFDPVAFGVLTEYIDSQNNNQQSTNSTTGVTYLTLVDTSVDINSDYKFSVSFSIGHSATNSNSFVDIKDFGASVLPQVYTVEPKDNSNRTWVTLEGRLTPNPLGGGQIQLQLDFGTDDAGDTTTMYFANISLQKINE